MEEVSIYGFGSFFNNRTEFRDIDMLIIHPDINYNSCQFSLICKRYLLSIINNIELTILSCSEEKEIDFIKKSNAKFLGIVKEDSVSGDFINIIKKHINLNHITLQDIRRKREFIDNIN